MGNCLKISRSENESLLIEDSNDHINQNHGTDERNSNPIIYYPSPNITRTANQLTEEEQVKIAKRIGLIQHLPRGKYDDLNKIDKECVICMVEFVKDEEIRYLPCMHIYHSKCIDDWLMRSFTCPSCMEPVDAALLTSYESSMFN
ncbi:unnamed protein product [Gordionus sp. m RMFG-2023]